MDKLIVFSCITSRFDPIEHILASLPKADSAVRYILFVDGGVGPAAVAKGWELWPFAWTHPNARRTARFHKVLAHRVLPAHERSCWIDGALQIKAGADMQELAAEATTSAMLATFQHPERRCVYEELQACLKFKKDDPQLMRRQIRRYKAEGYPTYNGLVETACLIRRDTPEVREFNERWWQEIEQGSLRDQLSFNYVTHQLGLPYGRIAGRRDESPYFTFRSHKRR